MKIKLVVISLLVSINLNANQDELYGFIGAGAGYAMINSDVAGDGGDKDGFYWQAQSFLSYYTKYFETNFGIGFLDTSQKPDNGAFTMTTQTTFLELAGNYRITSRFSLGLGLRQILGEELLFAPSSTVNVNNDITTNNTVGLHLNYDIPTKVKYKIKLQSGIHKAIDSNERDMYIGFLQIAFGMRLYQLQPSIEYVDRIKEVILEKPAQTIELSEKVLNFTSGSADIDSDAELFLRKIAALLMKNKNDWELIKIIGHTDSVGNKDLNKELSERRARSVANIFIDSGVRKDKLFYVGMGEELLKNFKKTSKAHSENRRVELKFVGKVDKSLANKLNKLINQKTRKNDTE